MMQLFEKLQKWMQLFQFVANLRGCGGNVASRSKHDYRLALRELWSPAPICRDAGLMVLSENRISVLMLNIVVNGWKL